MASTSLGVGPTPLLPATWSSPTSSPGFFDSSGAGITGGYTGDYLPLQILIAFFLGLSLYNALELIVLLFVTFQQYHGLYFWSLLVASIGIIPYSLGFLIKFFGLLDPNTNIGYVAVVLLTIGWYAMVTGQSVLLWSRLHLVTNSRRVLRWTKYMIITNAILLHSTTSVLTFGSNSTSLPTTTLARFIHGYSIMEKIQMGGFFLQELTLSGIYIFETVKLLKLSESVQDHVAMLDDDNETIRSNGGLLRRQNVRKTMYQLLAINVIIITMDLALLGVELANLYLIETTLKGVVYSIKLKLEYAVLGKLVQLIRSNSTTNHNSSNFSALHQHTRHTSSGSYRFSLPVVKLAKSSTMEIGSSENTGFLTSDKLSAEGYQHLPIDNRRISGDLANVDLSLLNRDGDEWETRSVEDRAEKRRSRTKAFRKSWIDEEMDRHNIE